MVLNAETHYLKATNFGLAIPTTATIRGIEVEIERKQSATGDVVDSEVKIVKADASIGTTNRADTVNSWPEADASATYGSPTDLWGETWTPANINDSDFGVVISADMTSDVNISIDNIRIKVYYSIPA